MTKVKQHAATKMGRSSNDAPHFLFQGFGDFVIMCGDIGDSTGPSIT